MTQSEEWDKRWREIQSYMYREWRRQGLVGMQGFRFSDSPLFTVNPATAIPNRLLFVHGDWDAVLPHLAMFAAARSGLAEPDVKVLTDLQLVEAKYGRDNPVLFSQAMSIRGLLLFRLGFQLTKNEELPAIIWEACRIRESQRLPTILVNEPITPWGSGHRAWSSGFSSYLEARFLRVEIPPPLTTP